jgi:glycosyltransferase involved in cell wall biosynthesis
MTKKKTIALFITADISTVQGSTEAHYVAKEFAERYDLHVYSPSNPEIKEATYYPIPDTQLVPALLLYNVFLLPYLLYFAWRDKWDVIYTYKGFTLSPYAISRLTKADWIADFRTAPVGQSLEWADVTERSASLARLYYMMFRVTYRLTLPRTQQTITLSESLRDHLISTYNIDNVLVVPLGVDTDIFTPKEVHHHDTDRIDLVYLGSISQLRGLETCLDALSSDGLTASVRFHIIGDGPEDYLTKLREKCDTQNINESVKWHGYVDHESVPSLLAEMDAAISPLPDYQSYQVSSPAKLYEYLAVGLPVVCSDITPHRELLTPGRTGVFYQPGSTPDLVRALNQLDDFDADTWGEIRHEARKVALRNNWEVRLETITNAIES